MLVPDRFSNKYLGLGPYQLDEAAVEAPTDTELEGGRIEVMPASTLGTSIFRI